MNLDYINLVKLIYLINAKMNGWYICTKNKNTFYLIKEKIKNYDFKEEMKKISIKEVNL